MNPSPRKPFIRLPDEGAQLVARLLGCLPAATMEMEALCRMAGIRVSRDIPTAAVECVYRPRLLINPDFVAQYCRRDEHLFLLVMHELWHVILAHTHLYARATPAHNIAFDAIINAGLVRLYRKPEFQGFFEALNAPDKFPHLLLRPPVGWPNDPQYPDAGPPGTREILERLYPPSSGRQVAMPFYEELLKLLRQWAEANGWIDGLPILLGDHSGNSDAEGHVLRDPVWGNAIQRFAQNVPTQVLGGKPGQGGPREEWLSDVGSSSEQTRRAFSQVLRRCLGPQDGGERQKKKMLTPGTVGTSVLPNPRDRLATARRLLGMPNTIWTQPGSIKARLPDNPSKAHIYLDVSGSMGDLLPYLLGLMIPYVKNGQADLFQFSTFVEPLSLSRLQRGRLNSSGGTNINCVLDHVLAAKTPVRRVLLLTDGETGTPADELIVSLRETAVQVYVVLPAESAWEEDLEELASSVTILPPLWGGRSARPL
jgi:hypothetical protein